MPRFVYTAYTEDGRRTQAQVEAVNLKEAQSKLRASGLTLTNITQEQESAKAASGSARKKLSLAETEFLTAELSLLLNSGIRINRGLEIILKNCSGPLARVVEQLFSDVKQGKTLAEAFAAHPESFDPLFANMVKVGEATGTLPNVFNRLSDTLRFRKRISSQVRQALTYPAFIMVVCVAVILFVFNFIVPRLTVMFEGVSELPVYTEILLGVTDWVTSYQIPAGVLLVLAGVSVYYWGRTQNGKAALWSFFGKIPLAGPQIRLLERLRYSSAMALLLTEGIALDTAMDLAADSVTSPDYRTALDTARNDVKQGSTLAISLEQTGLFPPGLIGMVEVGEESGNLARIFQDIQTRSSEEFEGAVARLTTLLEPGLILFMGLIVGSIVVVMLMSIVSVEDVGF